MTNPEILKPTVVLGPYTLRDWNAAESATFERASWYNGQAKFDRVVLRLAESIQGIQVIK